MIYGLTKLWRTWLQPIPVNANIEDVRCLEVKVWRRVNYFCNNLSIILNIILSNKYLFLLANFNSIITIRIIFLLDIYKYIKKNNTAFSCYILCFSLCSLISHFLPQLVKFARDMSVLKNSRNYFAMKEIWNNILNSNKSFTFLFVSNL